MAVVPPEICKNCNSPAISAFMPSTPVGVAITSTSRPCLLKIPAERATHGGHMTDDIDVNAMRTLRSGCASAPNDGALVTNAKRKANENARRDGVLLPAIEALSVFSKDPRFSLLGNILPAADRLRYIRKHAVPVRIVGGEKYLVVTDVFDSVGQRLFLRFEGKEPVAPGDILARFIFTQRCFDFATLFPFLIHPFDPIGRPTDTTF